ncbi:MAG: FKBP-type peptidyl-prolyl cis-trans isomerase [Alistipes sp.]|nr:FKBP-type peptidyl-prolyl cis-trans isomerase [Alistipes sp.]
MKKSIMMVAAAVGSVIMLASCGGNGLITKGNSSELDTLSYALGANIGYGMAYEMSDIPFDMKEIAKGIDEAAMDKADQTQEEAIELLRDYFMVKRGERTQAIMAERAKADSIRLAGGDSTRVEYPVADPAMFETEEEREALSYAFGVDVGTNVKNSGIPIQLYWLNKGIADIREGNGKLTEDEINEFLQNYFMVVRPQQIAERSAAWLAQVEKKSGVKKTESGLLYKVVKAGDENVKATDDRDIVVVHYKGTTDDGTVFDSSYDRGEPAEFPLDRVIPGWTEGMKLVGKGGKITLWLPSDLAYGPRGAGRNIGPNQALQFEVELLDVKPFLSEEAPAEAAVEAAPAE